MTGPALMSGSALMTGQGGTSADLVMLFDGVCNLCNASVDFYLRRDRAARIRFASMQSAPGQTLLGARDLPRQDFQTVVVLDAGRVLQKSDATLRLLQALPAPWPRIARTAALVPRFLRDWIYDRVARNRYGLAGRRAACRVPTPDEAARFLT